MVSNNAETHALTIQQHQQSQLIPLIQFIAGLLLGSGGVGAAIALIGKGFQLYGLVTLLICVVAAGLFFIAGIRVEGRRRRENMEFEERRRQNSLKLLNNYYVDCFKTIGDLLAYRLQDDTKGLNISDVFRILVGNLRIMGQERKGESKELIGLFRDGTKEIIDKWETLARKGVPREVPPKQEE